MAIRILFFLFLLAIILFVKHRVKNNEAFRKKLVAKLKSISIVFFMPYWVLVAASSLVFYIYVSSFSTNFSSNSNNISSSLKYNLSNLNGEWGYKNDKEDETWWLQICYNESAKNGTYVLSQKYDAWGEDKAPQLKTISQGQFTLIEGYDSYGDKAYIGRNITTGNSVFAITQIENKYAVDWLLRIPMIEDVMFGERMSKISNECK
jgi:hypothetical protein